MAVTKNVNARTDRIEIEIVKKIKISLFSRLMLHTVQRNHCINRIVLDLVSIKDSFLSKALTLLTKEYESLRKVNQ